ncbi:MAG: hypothetical protein LBC84_06830 [Prevotellaceae bacterium]|jgi:hypothetical protein|nr:hypothetical protein [Prevotellaceae bacterium]
MNIYTIIGFSLVLGYFIGFFVSKMMIKKRTVVCTDVYHKTQGVTTKVQLENACAVKLANEIRASGALGVRQTGNGSYSVSLRVIK